MTALETDAARPTIDEDGSPIAAGALAALLLGLVGAVTAGTGLPPGTDDLAFALGRRLALATMLYSVGLFALLAALGGAVSGIAFSFVARRPTRVFATVLGSGIALLVFLHASARAQLDGLTGLPLDHPARWRMAALHVLLAISLGLLVAALATRLARDRWFRPRAVLWTALPCALPWLVSTLLFARGQLGEPTPEPTARGATTPDKTERMATIPRIVVVGLDGLTLRVLAPMARAGELPTFARLLGEGAWGPLMTYGTASSPRVWTTLATGRKTRVHGIDDFVRARGRYRATALRSTDRRAPALWNLLGDAGRRIAVVDWMMTFPPESIHGMLLTRLADRRPRSHPPALANQLAALGEPLPDRSDEQAHRLAMVDRVFGVAEELLERDPVDFLALYDNAADAVQHRHWRHHQPEAFDTALWGPAETARASWVGDVYRHLDHRLGRLVERLGPETLLLVVSDHGQRAAVRPRIRLRLDRLLAELGYLELDAAGEPAYERSRAYPLVETLWTPTLRVSLNVMDREPRGIVPRRRADALLDRLENDLRSLRLVDDTPLFRRIERSKHALEPGAGADLELIPSARLRELATAGSELVVSGTSVAAADFVEIDRSISGEHDHRGILIVHGPGVRPGYLGQRTLETPAHRLLWHLTDKIDALDLLLPPLRELGLLDPASTLDLTPTLLALSGLPIARDMPGRPLTELFENPPPITFIDSYQPAWKLKTHQQNPDETQPDDPAQDQEMIERLEALGYVG